MSGVGSPAFLPPADFVRSPESLDRFWSPGEGRAYTRWLATHHYENFHVVSLLLPKRLHQDFYNVYSFCRWADDLGDEIGDTAESLRLLQRWRGQLRGRYRGNPAHPLFVARKRTGQRQELPESPFDGLNKALENDQTVSRYRNFDELFQYWRS